MIKGTLVCIGVALLTVGFGVADGQPAPRTVSQAELATITGGAGNCAWRGCLDDTKWIHYATAPSTLHLSFEFSKLHAPALLDNIWSCSPSEGTSKAGNGKVYRIFGHSATTDCSGGGTWTEALSTDASSDVLEIDALKCTGC